MNQRPTEEIPERHRAQGELRRQAERLAILHEIDRAILAVQSPTLIAQTALRHLRRLVRAPRVALALYDLAAGEATWLAVDADGETALSPGVRFPLELMGDLAGLRRGTVQVVEVRSLHHLGIGRTLAADGIQSYAVVPLLAQGALIGSLNVGAREAGGPPAEDLAAAREIADQLAVALQQARLREQLERSRDLLRAVIDSAPVAIYALATDGTVTMWNPAAERMFGWTEGEVLGRPLPTLPPGKQEEFRALFERTRRGEALTGVEVRRQRKDGSPIDLLASNAPLRGADGTVQGLVNLSLDISERKQAAERAEALARVGRELVQTLDARRVVELIVAHALSLLRVRSAALFTREGHAGPLVCIACAGATELDHWSGRTLAPGQGVAGLAVLEGRPVWSPDFLADPRVQVPGWLAERAKSEDYGAALAVPLTAQGEVTGVLGVGDVAGRAFTDEDLRLLSAFADQAAMALQNARLYQHATERAEKLTTLSTLTRLITSTAGTREVFAGVAKAAVTLLGAKTARVWVAQPEQGVLRAEGGFGLDRALETRTTEFPTLPFGEGVVGAVFASGRAEYIADIQQEPRVKNRRFAAEAGLHAGAGIPLIVGDRVVGVLSILFNDHRAFTEEDQELMRLLADQAAIVIEQSRLFEELQGSYRDLQQTQAQLAQAQKMEAVGQLAGGVAHDFNNLLTVIGGRSALLLQRGEVSGAVRDDVELIGKTADRAAALTRQLLAFSRKQVLEPRPVDPNALVSGVTPMLRRLIGEHIELVIVAGNDLGHVMADPGQVEQVIVNLVVNARDAMPAGGMVKIETAGRELQEAAVHPQGHVPPGEYVALSVQDTGSGMDAATLARIFEPFFTTKEPGKGTGLGLSTVHGIVHQSGGHIGVDSAPGRGTTFMIYLPRIAVADTAADSPKPSAQGLTRGTETVLLVEDEEEVRRLASEILRECGYTVLDTGDPLEALTMADRRSGAVDLLVTDMVMPAMGGSELAERLKAACRGMRVLYISGYTDEMITQAGTSGPGRAFLQKPFTPHDLTRKVREALTRA